MTKKRVFLRFQKRISQAFAVWFYWNWKCTRIILCSYCWFILWQKNPLGSAAGVKIYQFIVLKGSEWLQLAHFLIDFVQFRTEYTQKSTFQCVHKNIKIFHFETKKSGFMGFSWESTASWMLSVAQLVFLQQAVYRTWNKKYPYQVCRPNNKGHH